jgi:putative membrane protein
MIKYNPKTWFRHIFMFHRSDTMSQLFSEMMIMALYTGIITFVLLEYVDDVKSFKNTLSVHALIGFIMGLLLVFRTNTAYDRWWEGRRLWGMLVNQARNLALKCKSFIGNKDETALTKLERLIIAYPYAAKEHLRKGVDVHKLNLDEDCIHFLKNKKHKPNAIALLIYQELNKLFENKKISGEHLLNLDQELKEFTNIIGACERIRNTPIPFSYTLFIKKFIFIYVFTLPFGLIPDFHYWSIPVVMFVFYVMVSLEILAEEIEDPFGTDDNDLPTDELAGKIDDSVHEIMSSRESL